MMASSQDFLPVVSENSIPQKTFSDFLSALTEAWELFSENPGALAAGDPLLAIFQATSSQLTFVESLAAWIAAFARATTSSGSALDSWMSQFGFPRLPASPATTNDFVLSRATPAVQNYNIPLGKVFQTSQGIQFELVADSSQTAYQSGGGGYYLFPIGATSITTTIQALVPGTSGNVPANSINQFVSQVTGIQSANNPVSLSDGTPPETDAAFRARFILYFQGLRQGGEAAIEAAIESVQAGLEYVIAPNLTYSGGTQYGYFYVAIWPYTDALQVAVYNAIAAVIPLGIQFNVFTAVMLPVTVTGTIEVAAGYNPATVQAAVQTALASFINSLALGQSLYWSYLFEVIYSVPGVANALDLLVNGGTSDIIALPKDRIQAASVSIALSTSTA